MKQSIAFWLIIIAAAATDGIEYDYGMPTLCVVWAIVLVTAAILIFWKGNRSD